MKEIKIQLGDWLYNAGVVGFVNILLHANDNILLNGQTVTFSADVLYNFEEKYFKYFIDTYEKTLSWYKIVKYKEFIEKYEQEDYTNFSLKDLDHLNNFIGTNSKSGSLKYFLTSNSYVKAYKLISLDVDVINLLKGLSTIKMKKSDTLSNKMNEIIKAINKLKIIISYFENEETRKYIGAMNVIYTIIKHAWKDVSFLNRTPSTPDMYQDYKKYFLDIAYNYITKDKKNDKYRCSICNNNMSHMNQNLSFLNATGFDTNRKPSHVWNFNNDIAVCPICLLIYSCVPAGFTYVYNRGIFINQNQDVNSAVKVNQMIKSEVLEDNETNIYRIYQVISQQIKKKSNAGIKYELADVQVVRYENEKYRFNLLSRKMLSILNDSTKLLNSLIKSWYKEGNTNFNIYDEVIKKLLNNENLFLFIHKLIVLKMTKQNVYYHVGHIFGLLNINQKILEGVVGMEKKSKDILEISKHSGYYFRKAYESKQSENKINGIAYRLLNSLKTNNKHLFMDTLLNCYLYIKQSVPTIFVEGMKNDDVFKSIGYAFVAGIINEFNKNENGGEKHD